MADGAITDAITNHLFAHQTAPDEGFDLIALNIQESTYEYMYSHMMHEHRTIIAANLTKEVDEEVNCQAQTGHPHPSLPQFGLSLYFLREVVTTDFQDTPPTSIYAADRPPLG